MAPISTGERLKKLRELAGLPQAAVAAHMGFDRAFLSMVESGYKNINDKDAKKIEEFLMEPAQKAYREYRDLVLTPASA